MLIYLGEGYLMFNFAKLCLLLKILHAQICYIHCVMLHILHYVTYDKLCYIYLRNKETQQILWVTNNMLCNASLWYN